MAARAHAPGVRSQVRLRRRTRYTGRRHAPWAGSGTVGRASRARDATGIRLPPSLESRRSRRLGQPLHHSPRPSLRPRSAPRAAPRQHRRNLYSSRDERVTALLRQRLIWAGFRPGKSPAFRQTQAASITLKLSAAGTMLLMLKPVESRRALYSLFVRSWLPSITSTFRSLRATSWWWSE